MSNRKRLRPYSRDLVAQAGVSLIELMIAMTLALAIVGAVTYVYLQGKQGFSVQDNRSLLQENSRLAVSLISRDIEMGGYFGCVKPVVDTNTDPPLSTIRITAAQPLMQADIGWLELDNNQLTGTRFLNPAMTIRGYDDGVGWPVGTGVSTKRFSGTDTLIILRGGDDARHLVASSTESEFTITSPLPGAKSVSSTPPIVISDCTRGEIIKPTVRTGAVTFSVANTLNQNAAITDPIKDILRYAPYPSASMVTTFEPVSYYVALAKGKNGSQVPSLHRLVTQTDSLIPANVGLWKASGDVIIEGVERFQLRYFAQGAAEGSSAGPFTAAEVSAANKWLLITAVQVDLTLVGDDDGIRTESSTQTVGGTSVTDKKIRLVTSFSASVRNPKA